MRNKISSYMTYVHIIQNFSSFTRCDKILYPNPQFLYEVCPNIINKITVPSRGVTKYYKQNHIPSRGVTKYYKQNHSSFTRCDKILYPKHQFVHEVCPNIIYKITVPSRGVSKYYKQNLSFFTRCFQILYPKPQFLHEVCTNIIKKPQFLHEVCTNFIKKPQFLHEVCTIIIKKPQFLHEVCPNIINKTPVPSRGVPMYYT